MKRLVTIIFSILILQACSAPKKAIVNERIHDIWNTIRIDGKSISTNLNRPRLEINLTEMRLFGNDGCNEIQGDILEITANRLSFTKISATRKMCQNMDSPNNYNSALNKVMSYKLDGLHLLLFDSNGKEVLAFLKGD